MMEALATAGVFLLQHADLLEDIVKALEAGTPKDALRLAIREAKVKVSDAAMREELGLK